MLKYSIANKATEINLVWFNDGIQIVRSPRSYVNHYFNNNDNSKINYLSSPMPQRDQVIYASIVNVTLA